METHRVIMEVMACMSDFEAFNEAFTAMHEKATEQGYHYSEGYVPSSIMDEPIDWTKTKTVDTTQMRAELTELTTW